MCLSIGAWECYDCPAGYMCTRQVAADPCKQGYFCPGKTGYDIQPCPSGTFGSRTGLVSKGECTNCTAGSYCEGTGLAIPTGPCDPGHWCQVGVNTKAPDGNVHTGLGGICSTGHECPGNTSLPVPCLNGYYSNIAGVSSCFLCTAGNLFMLRVDLY